MFFVFFSICCSFHEFVGMKMRIIQADVVLHLVFVLGTAIGFALNQALAWKLV